MDWASPTGNPRVGTLAGRQRGCRIDSVPGHQLFLSYWFRLTPRRTTPRFIGIYKTKIAILYIIFLILK